ncbi:MAG: MBL fold metallo-hydrolase [Betaproteobacteria bacterium]|nr:MBL fold metallo-hydrolase [Betaproteobacteria bacterium]MDE2424223.1 MBL fold metallo-hydrolase [Betaproteobacteria bacterium]
MRFASLGSGSEGNAWLVESGETCLMVDCGFSVNELARRFTAFGMTAQDLTAIVVTHEHSDHLSGVARLAKRFNLPVYASFGTLSFCREDIPESLCHELFSDHPVIIGDIQVNPFLVPHDAREPLQFVFDDSKKRLGIVTDVGHVTQHMIHCLQNLDALALESNHDETLLSEGSYPQPLKVRVKGEFGHLSNAQAVDLLKELNVAKLSSVVAAHLSQANNRPELVYDEFMSVVQDEERFAIATQQEGLAWRPI